MLAIPETGFLKFLTKMGHLEGVVTTSSLDGPVEKTKAQRSVEGSLVMVAASMLVLDL